VQQQTVYEASNQLLYSKDIIIIPQTRLTRPLQLKYPLPLPPPSLAEKNLHNKKQTD
jgi:hypothetical protein